MEVIKDLMIHLHFYTPYMLCDTHSQVASLDKGSLIFIMFNLLFSFC